MIKAFMGYFIMRKGSLLYSSLWFTNKKLKWISHRSQTDLKLDGYFEELQAQLMAIRLQQPRA
jgi:hypothetical protein